MTDVYCIPPPNVDGISLTGAELSEYNRLESAYSLCMQGNAQPTVAPSVLTPLDKAIIPETSAAPAPSAWELWWTHNGTIVLIAALVLAMIAVAFVVHSRAAQRH